VTLARRTLTLLVGFAIACGFDPAYRDVVEGTAPAPCVEGAIECAGTSLARCEGGRRVTIDDCPARGLVCAPSLLACTPCVPESLRCEGQRPARCDARGQSYVPGPTTCDTEAGVACRDGVCENLCVRAEREQSNVGCEYWAVDLDNAFVSPSLNAAAQQFAVVVSNAQPDVTATVTIEEDTAAVGAPNAPRVVGTARVGPRNLEVFKLGPAEVDGSPDGEFDTGPGTALTRHAFRIRASVPIVAYQFNPLENANVFSNDASQLLPTPALGGVDGRAYVVASWPQTIAAGHGSPFGSPLRGFVAIVGTRADTHVRVKTRARIIPGGPLPGGLAIGDEASFTLQPFEVLNLESEDFNSDFTGTFVDSDKPVALFPGSEASDAPFFGDYANRFCCADHLEEQGVPVRAAGKSYVCARMPNRTRAVAAAGAVIGAVDEPEYYRIVATRKGTTRVTTTLPPPYSEMDLPDEGTFVTIAAYQDFVVTASQAVIVADVQASQEAAGVLRGLPGGDPSLTFVPPIEQWRNDYTLLTPDKYAFDFLVVMAPAAAHVFVDGTEMTAATCEVGPADGLDERRRGGKKPPYLAYRCQLSFPVIDPAKTAPNNVLPGRQNDGVHRVQADLPVGVIVYGFDSFVSYAYPGGTQLREINVR
jgi:hypothetical protein